ncbi:MAG: DUF2200 family protein [Erysipelotrichaceae bacterium]
MKNEKIYSMPFNKVYPLLINKAERKNRNKSEVLELTSWLLGYSEEEINNYLNSEISYGDFFINAPKLNPFYLNIKGSICGIKIEEIEEDLMRQIRCLDKLVDELSKGKSIAAIKEKYAGHK